MAVSAPPDPPISREEKMEPPSSALQRNTEELVEEPTPSGMRSRLQRLAQQRKCWDGDGEDVLMLTGCFRDSKFAYSTCKVCDVLL